jgi:hypothetical protein
MEVISVTRSHAFMVFFGREGSDECLFQWTDTHDSYLGGAQIESWLGHKLSCLGVFMVYLSL